MSEAIKVVSSLEFSQLLEEGLGHQFNRASMAFENWGPHLSYDLFVILREAVGMGPDTVTEVLDQLDAHYVEHLIHQLYQLRGLNRSVDDPTQRLLTHICINTLGFEAATSDTP